MSFRIKILCIFVLVTVQSYAAQNINIKKSGMEFSSFLGLDCNHHTCIDNMEKICGIYKITSPTKKIYIGQSKNILNRWNIYKGLRCEGQSRLYKSFIKYGVGNHTFEIIHQCLPEELNGLEKYYVDLYQTFNTNNGLNLKDGGGSKVFLSDETKNKISAKAKGNKRCLGRIMSDETRLKIGLANRDNSAEYFKNKSMWKKPDNDRVNSMQGKKHTPETLIKISKSLKGRKLSSEHIMKIRLAVSGRVTSEETKIKISLANTGKKRPDLSLYNSKFKKGVPISQEHKDKVSITMKKYRANKKEKCQQV